MYTKYYIPKHLDPVLYRKRIGYKKHMSTLRISKFVTFILIFIITLSALPTVPYSLVNPYLHSVSKGLKNQRVTKDQIIEDQKNVSFSKNTVSYLKKMSGTEFKKVLNAKDVADIVKISNNNLNTTQANSISLSIDSTRKRNTITVFRNKLFNYAYSAVVFSIIGIFLFSTIILISDIKNKFTWKKMFYFSSFFIKELIVLIIGAAGLYTIISSNTSIEALSYTDHITYVLFAIPIFIFGYTYISCYNIFDFFITKI
ncbi:hypothetical protein [Leuconostoc gasicomitatum]|uniref:hypothetical protein n=1 Tax=Leuconostoc gasicomitatum TaxID=115778 RepID=UPI000744938F|nr:hypothetical protein [Leuconostoc gasicomitatum]CUR63468.1 Uncharacterized protein LEKG_0881 [Leuconostoc gasicomitatum KG16-1]